MLILSLHQQIYSNVDFEGLNSITTMFIFLVMSSYQQILDWLFNWFLETWRIQQSYKIQE